MFENTPPTEERNSLIWFVSRHPGALDWARQNGIAFDRLVAHLDTQKVSAGDKVIGSLPVNLAAEVCARGAEYWNLSLRVAERDRGRELSAEELQGYNAIVERYDIRKCS
jgi:CRISPR-associated protein Csx16